VKMTESEVDVQMEKEDTLTLRYRTMDQVEKKVKIRNS
jgi:hypothetical protein